MSAMARSKRRKRKATTRQTRDRPPPDSPSPALTPSDGLPVRACFGDRCLDATLLVERSPHDESASVELRIAADELHRDPPDLAAQLRVYHHPSLGVTDPETARLGGYVTDLEPLNDGGWVVKAHNMANWGEFLIAGWGVRNHQAQELVYAMARSRHAAGTHPHRRLAPGI
jgi:hypothetical protein